MTDDPQLVARARALIVSYVDAANRRDSNRVVALSVLGAGAVSLVNGYLQTLFMLVPLTNLEIRYRGTSRGRMGPKWARWVEHDKVSFDVEFDSALGHRVREIVVWLYGQDGELGAQLASRLALPGEKDQRAQT